MTASLGQLEQLLPTLLDRASVTTAPGCLPLAVFTPVEHAAGVLVVKENAPHPSGFLAVLEVEVLIAPAFEDGEIARVHTITRRLQGAVKVAGVLEKGVVGR